MRSRRLAPVVALIIVLSGAVTLAPALSQEPSATPPPTPVPPAGSPSPYPTALVTPSSADKMPKLQADAAILVDLDSGKALRALNPEERRPIASITKIMTALLVLERTDPGDLVTVSALAAGQEGAELGLEPGEQIKVKQLLFALMLQSSNDGAVALAEHVGGSVEGFVAEMNDRVRELGLRDTNFASPNGLDDSGYSTAADMAAITREAFTHPDFDDVVATKTRSIPAPDGPDRSIQNRNALLWLYPDSIGVKTGFTMAAGFCLVAAAERDGLRLIAVVLGEPGEPFSDSAALLDHGFENWDLEEVVEKGTGFDPIEVGGRTVELAAGSSLEAVVRVGREVEVEAVVRDGLRHPIEVGDRVGRIIVTSEGDRLGRVPLVATYVEPPPTPVARWWLGAASLATAFLSDVFLENAA